MINTRLFRSLYVAGFFLILVLLSLWHKEASLGAFRVLDEHFCSSPPPNAEVDLSFSSLPLVHRNVAVATSFGYHLDVLFSLSWTLQRVMKDQGQLHVYLPSQNHWNIEGVVKEQGLYQGAIKSHEDLIKDLNDNQGDGGIDMVILGTCEIECVFVSLLSHLTGCNAFASLRDKWKKEILEAWDARDTTHKFQVVCMIHNAADTYWMEGVLPELARRGTIRMLSISHQCVIPLHLLVNLSDVFIVSPAPSGQCTDDSPAIPIPIFIPWATNIYPSTSMSTSWIYQTYHT